MSNDIWATQPLAEEAAAGRGGFPDASAPLARVPVNWASEPTPVFANVVHVGHSDREFAIMFGDEAPFPGRGGVVEGQPPEARIVASLRCTPEGFFDVLRTLTNNWNRFILRRGEPGQVMPRFELQACSIPGSAAAAEPAATEDDAIFR